MIKIGDSIYFLVRNYYGYPEKEYIEINGQTWFRYKETKDRYTLRHYTVSGFVFQDFVGEIDDEEGLEDHIYLRDESGELTSEFWDRKNQKIIDYREAYFTDEQEAIKELNRLNEETDFNVMNKKK